MTTTAQILRDFDRWSAQCEESEYTDTGDAWLHLNRLADELRTLAPPSHRAFGPAESSMVGAVDYQPRHSAHETILVYVEARRDGSVMGEAIRRCGDAVDSRYFDVEDNEPDDVWGPIMGRILEDLGIDLGPDNYDGGPLRSTLDNVETILQIDVRHKVDQ